MGHDGAPTAKKAIAEYEKNSKEDKNQYKAPYNRLALYGDYFPKIKYLKFKFTVVSGEDEYEIENDLYYKNENKLACIVKEITDLSPGKYEANIIISINGIQWTETEQKILYMAPEEELSFDDI